MRHDKVCVSGVSLPTVVLSSNIRRGIIKHGTGEQTWRDEVVVRETPVDYGMV